MTVIEIDRREPPGAARAAMMLQRAHWAAELFARYDAADQYADDELVKRLEEMRESVRRRYELGRTLDEQLAEAVKAEDYELAARIRARIRRGETVTAEGTVPEPDDL